MRRMITVGVLGLFVGALALVPIAEARAGRGGGGFSGSRGSRSYSAPRAPATPAQPGSPNSLSATPRAPASPFRPGGFLGGLGGMLGGFVLGGLLGSLLFGGLGGALGRGLGGFGLMDMLLVAGLVFLAFRYFKGRQATPAMAGAGGASPWGPGSTSAYGAREAALPASGPAPATATLDSDAEDRDRGLAAIQVLDPGFDPRAFAATARDAFVRVQVAWNARDLGPVKDELTEELAASLESDVARLKAERRLNRLERLEVTAAELTEAWEEKGRDFVTVRIAARGVDYTLDEATGAVVEGSRTELTAFEEFWTFTRPVGPNPWRASAIQQASR